MLNPGENEMTLSTLVMKLKPELSGILETLGTSTGKGSVSMNPTSAKKSSRSRAIAESILVFNLMEPLKAKLSKDGLLKSFQTVEMPSVLTLSQMELNGFGFCQDECEKQRKILIARLEELEENAYKLAKRNFSMTSSEEICKVLYRELRLPVQGAKPSSAKDVLQKLLSLHELPGVILEWRKLNASVTKVVFPMSRAAMKHKGNILRYIH